MTAATAEPRTLVPVDITIGHDDIRIDVQLLGEPTGNPDLFVVPDVSGPREYDDWDDPVAFTGWTVLHKPTRTPVVGVSFTLDDGRIFANTIGHLDWSHFQRGKTPAERRDSLHGRVVSAALKGVGWW
jgi:hypothetical protein